MKNVYGIGKNNKCCPKTDFKKKKKALFVLTKQLDTVSYFNCTMEIFVLPFFFFLSNNFLIFIQFFVAPLKEKSVSSTNFCQEKEEEEEEEEAE